MPRRPKKGKSTSLLIRNMIKNMDDVQLALVRERLLHVAEMTLSDLKLNPHKYKNGIIAPGLIESTMQKINKGLAYESEKPKANATANVSEPELVEITQ